jgi:hypothetical protein
MDRFLTRGEAAPAKLTPEKKLQVVAAAVSPVPAPPILTVKQAKKRTPKKQAAASESEGRTRQGSSPHTSPSPPRFDGETGNGSVKKPFVLPLRENYNDDDCMHCPSSRCCCVWIGEAMRRAYEQIGVKRTHGASRHTCAKSILPPFVTRLAKITSLTDEDTFVDLGCGNGSVLFQIAFMTGARCIGVELLPQNAEVARKAWELLKPVLEKKAKRRMPEVTIVCGDLCEVIASPQFGISPTVVWTANLLMPKSVTHFMSERFRSLPVGTRIMCFDDLYPHSRSVARIRDPEAFALFKMVDYVWQEMSVEWCTQTGPFFVYYKRK